MLGQRDVFLRGRILLIKTKLLFLIQYISALNDIPAHHEKAIDQLALKLLWKGKTGMVVVRQKMVKAVQQGGLDFPFLRAAITSRRGHLMGVLLDDQFFHFWMRAMRADCRCLLDTRTSGPLSFDELLTARSLRWTRKRITPAWYKNLKAWKALDGRPDQVDATWSPAKSASLPFHSSAQTYHVPGGHLSANCAHSQSINQVGQIVWSEEYNLDCVVLRAAKAGQQD